MTTIVRLTASNVKRLKAIDITPSSSGVTVIGGKNAAGKSSVLDAILYAFSGGRTIPGRPIRDGEKSAEVVVETADFIVKRRFTEKGTRLEVTTPEGAAHKSPQAILDQYVGAISFDPMAFMHASPTDQARILRDAIGVDTTTVEQRRESAYNARRDIGRDVRSLEARLASAANHPDAPDEEVSLDDLRAEYVAAQERNRWIDSSRRFVEAAAQQARDIHEEIERLEAALVDAKRRFKEANEAHSAAIRAEVAAGDPVDLGEITARVGEIDKINAKVRENAARKAIESELADAKKSHAAKDAEIDECDRDRELMLADAGMPIDGLDVTDDGVTYCGVPIGQASTSEQIRVSCAIAFAANPKLRVAFVRDGSLLDDDAMAELASLAGQHEFQVWVERVGSSDPGAVIIEDGAIAVGGDS